LYNPYCRDLPLTRSEFLPDVQSVAALTRGLASHTSAELVFSAVPSRRQAWRHSEHHLIVTGAEKSLHRRIKSAISGTQFGTQKCAARAVEAVDAVHAVRIFRRRFSAC